LPDNRPDLRAAVARYEAGVQRRIASGAAFAPSFGVNAQGGLQWRRADDEDVESQENWGIGLSLNVPLLNAATIGNARQSRAAELAARDALHQQVLAAVGEVEQGLARSEELSLQLAAVQRQVEAARTAFEVSSARFSAGLDDYLTLLTSWNSLLQDELSEINVRRSLLGADLRLRAALGGAWTRRVRASGE
jgi:multidrug efflux system outer membrane protein